ncbi:DUF6461 domain-containing protein [Paractinoplanes durhamensis]|nr:DUF6461 domain-containing protein [Actinoplanes durhamensis]
MSDSPVPYYTALLDAHPWMREALCLTWACGLGEGDLIRGFGGDPAAAEPMTIAVFEQLTRSEGLDVVKVGPAGGEWLLAMEGYGFQGSRREVLRSLSRRGQAVNVYWNINAYNHFSYAQDGRTVTVFDMSGAGDRYGTDPAALDNLMTGLPFHREGDHQAAGLALAERITGCRLTLDLLAATLPSAVFTPVPQDLVPEDLIDHPALADPFLQDLLAEPTRAALPAIGHRMAAIVAEDAGIGDYPEVQEVLAGSGPPVEAVRERLLARYLGLAAVAEDYSAGERRGAALWTMYAIGEINAQLGPDPNPQRRDRMVQGAFHPLRPDLAAQFEVLTRVRDHLHLSARG